MAENEQQGTYHGTAGVMFLTSDTVKAGILRRDAKPDRPRRPEVQDDFRSVYATVLSNWFKADAKKVLSGEVKTVTVIA